MPSSGPLCSSSTIGMSGTSALVSERPVTGCVRMTLRTEQSDGPLDQTVLLPTHAVIPDQVAGNLVLALHINLDQARPHTQRGHHGRFSCRREMGDLRSCCVALCRSCSGHGDLLTSPNLAL
jgi:hypothetical protein